MLGSPAAPANKWVMRSPYLPPSQETSFWPNHEELAGLHRNSTSFQEIYREVGPLKSVLILTNYFFRFHRVLLLDSLCFLPPPRQSKLGPVCPWESLDTIIQASKHSQESATPARGPALTFFPRNLRVHPGHWGRSGPCPFSNSLPLLLAQALGGGVHSPCVLSICSLVSPVNWEKVERVSGRSVSL